MRVNRTRLPLIAVCGALCLGLLAAGPAAAQDEENGEEESQEIAKQVLVTNLNNPCGVTVHDETGHVFISNVFGVYRFIPKESNPEPPNIEILLEGNDVYGEGPKYDIGPLGLDFMDSEHLVIGGGRFEDGKELVYVYKIGEEPAEESMTEDDAAVTLGPIEAEEGVTEKGEGNFYGVAVGAGSIFISTNGDDTKGWVAKAEIKDGKPVDLQPSIATKEAVELDAPVPLTFTPDGKELVVGQMGEITNPGDSLICFYDPESGELKNSYEAGLSDICGVAYSPKTEKLYAVDFAWLDAAAENEEDKEGGLYELAIEDDQVTTTKIMPLDKPTAIAFDKDGNLFITELGTAEETEEGDNDDDDDDGDDDEAAEQKYPGTLSVIPAEAGL